MISSVLSDNKNVYGRLNIIEKDREFNPADLYLADYLNKSLTIILSHIEKNKKTQESLKPYFVKMLLGLNVSETEILYWKNYIRWKETDQYRILVMIFNNTEFTPRKSVLIRNYIQNMIPQTLAVSIDNQIALCISDIQLKKFHDAGIIQHLIRWNLVSSGLSLPFYGTSNITYYYRQALYAANNIKHLSNQEKITDFYFLAVEYMITNKMDDSFEFACHPDIIALYRSSQNNSDVLKTYFMYLGNNECISKTSREMFLHKNTLQYRIRKIEKTFLYNDNSIYTKKYMYLSLYILHLLEQTKQADFSSNSQKVRK